MACAADLHRVAARRAALAIAMFACACAAGAAAAERSQPIEGVVSFVIDGDTIMLQPGAQSGRAIKLRLRGLDAPEICQRGGPEARDALAQRVLGRHVSVGAGFEDDYRRRIATVGVDGEDVGAWMVAQGHAWNARFRGRPGPYAQEERAARAARRGLFADADPVPPRVFRRSHASCYPAPAP